MWILRKKENKETETKETFSLFSVGERFNYCGIEMMVEELGERDLYLGHIRSITAVYKNKLGELKRMYFYHKHLPALIAENKSKQI